MSTKTTLSHRTKTGKVETRKTERDYTHVVVYRYTVKDAGYDAEAARRSAERTEADRQYMLRHIDEAEEFSSGEMYVKDGYRLLTLDEEWYEKTIRKDNARAEKALARAEHVFVASWHGSAMLAAKAADKLRARGYVGIAVEAINGGERD